MWILTGFLIYEKLIGNFLREEYIKWGKRVLVERIVISNFKAESSDGECLRFFQLDWFIHSQMSEYCSTFFKWNHNFLIMQAWTCIWVCIQLWTHDSTLPHLCFSLVSYSSFCSGETKDVGSTSSHNHWHNQSLLQSLVPLGMEGISSFFSILKFRIKIQLFFLNSWLISTKCEKWNEIGEEGLTASYAYRFDFNNYFQKLH